MSDLETWLDQHGECLFRIAMLRVRERHLAEDLVQETFMAALQSRGAFNGKSSGKTWLVEILMRKIADHFRRNPRELSSSESELSLENMDDYFTDAGRWANAPIEWDSDPALLDRKKEFIAVFEDCLSGISPHLADAYILREVEKMNHQDICAVLNISETNLCSILHRARMLLRRRLDARWFGKKADKGEVP
ncbi:sigma-70 family RNA polymerase sigma factor [bacterium]|nr:sigma-70 family RNA polymerase sigma factor [bacterium]